MSSTKNTQINLVQLIKLISLQSDWPLITSLIFTLLHQVPTAAKVVQTSAAKVWMLPKFKLLQYSYSYSADSAEVWTNFGSVVFKLWQSLFEQAVPTFASNYSLPEKTFFKWQNGLLRNQPKFLHLVSRPQKVSKKSKTYFYWPLKEKRCNLTNYFFLFLCWPATWRCPYRGTPR